MARAATLALLTLLTASVTAQDCEDLGGQCLDWEDYICHAGWETGLCPGDENIRCCLSCDAECEWDCGVFFCRLRLAASIQVHERT